MLFFIAPVARRVSGVLLCIRVAVAQCGSEPPMTAPATLAPRVPEIHRGTPSAAAVTPPAMPAMALACRTRAPCGVSASMQVMAIIPSEVGAATQVAAPPARASSQLPWVRP
ncbi:MAG: hypothetical protein EB084_08115 [Proteobacteria bacterium]|nr:hypothetical protein [Pseudomonadota bacterium]